MFVYLKTIVVFYSIPCVHLLFHLWYSGLADVEEGEVNGQELLLNSCSVGRMSFGAPPAVKQVNLDILYIMEELSVSMSVVNTLLNHTI